MKHNLTSVTTLFKSVRFSIADNHTSLSKFYPTGGIPRQTLAPWASHVPAGKTASSKGGCDGYWWHGGGGAQWHGRAETTGKLQSRSLWGRWRGSQRRSAMSDAVISPCFQKKKKCKACGVYVVHLANRLPWDTSMQVKYSLHIVRLNLSKLFFFCVAVLSVLLFKISVNLC